MSSYLNNKYNANIYQEIEMHSIEIEAVSISMGSA
jgi:hypothetical protein